MVHAIRFGKLQKICSYVGATRKVSPDWSQKTMTCHSFNCFRNVCGQGYEQLLHAKYGL